MPLPLPNLDTRRWADLVDEGRALIPRYAPGWTDHNVHDPGVTLVELLAWLVEQDVYRANRVPERHLRKFLALAGIGCEPPRCARIALSFTLDPGVGGVDLPRGTTFAGIVGTSAPVRFRTTRRVRVAPAAIAAVQTWNGTSYADVTRLWRDGLPFAALGSEPVGFDGDQPPALMLGLDRPLPVGEDVWLWLAEAGSPDPCSELSRIRAETEARAEACRRPSPRARCDGGQAAPRAVLGAGYEPRALRTAWEYHDGTAWSRLAAWDETRGLTLTGAVRVWAAGAAAPVRLGVVPDALYWIRCHAAGGVPDEAPVLRELAVNAVLAEQCAPARAWLRRGPGAAPTMPPLVPGELARLSIELDADEHVVAVRRSAEPAVPATRVLGVEPDAIEATLALVGVGRGVPLQRFELPGAPVADGRLALWSIEADGPHAWEPRPDFDAASPSERVVVVDAQAGALRFGDGAQGRVPPEGAPLFAVYDSTDGARGNLDIAAVWSLAGADDDLNRALLGRDPAGVELATIASRGPAWGGAAAEDVTHAAGRAAETLWAHERLLELAPIPDATLDGLDPQLVLGRTAPQRATSTLDFERLALEVPGRRVRRVRAWAGLDAATAGLRAPGTVSVVVVNGYPADRPRPSPGLLRAVERYLGLRKTLGTRLVVTGPAYLEVTATTRVTPVPGADVQAVQSRVRDALSQFLHPLRGGEAGRGWPFGRDVYRAELLALVDGVPGVDSVAALTLATPGGDAGCGNVCVGPAQLVVSGPHVVEVGA